VELLRANAPDKPIVGRIARTAGAIDNTTRTLQVDIEVDNADRALMPGTYVDIVFRIDPSNLLVLPTNTLLFSPEGPQVATVRDGTVTRKAVKLGIDYGQMVQVRSGVEETDQIITSPPDSIADGQKVIIETPAPKAKKGP
ncbi:MAG: efflux transporter periplasmic adaptor subunit, partial [Burkholderiales bacterium]